MNTITPLSAAAFARVNSLLSTCSYLAILPIYHIGADAMCTYYAEVEIEL